MDAVFIQQFQIQVVEGKVTSTTILCINVNLERKEALVFDIDGVIQRQDAITFLTRCTDGFRIRKACVPVKDLFGILPGTLLGVCIQPENVVIFVSWGCGGNAVNIRIQIHLFGLSSGCIRASGLCCSIMGCLVLDGEVEDFLVCKAVFEVLSNVAQIDLFLNLQLVIIREVERHRHVGLPHTAFHVVHGKGVLFAFVEFKSSALRVEIDGIAIIFYGLDSGIAIFSILIIF